MHGVVFDGNLYGVILSRREYGGGAYSGDLRQEDPASEDISMNWSTSENVQVEPN